MAAVGGLPASADRFQVKLHCLCVMLGGAWDGKYGMYECMIAVLMYVLQLGMLFAGMLIACATGASMSRCAVGC